MTNQLPLTDSQKAVSIERVQLLHYSLSLSVPSLLSAAKGDNLEKGNPKDTIIQGYFPLSVFNDLFSRVIPADIEISYNYLIPFPLVICKHKGFLPSKKQEKKQIFFWMLITLRTNPSAQTLLPQVQVITEMVINY